jgi:predicted porin
VDYKKMLQLYLPVSVQYQLAKNHFILGGVGASYSFALSSNVKENQQATATQSYNYRGGFNQLDLFVQAGYLYKVNNAFSLFGYWQQGLIDATDNTYFNNSISTKQSKVSVGIKYNFKRNGLRTNKK